MKKIKFSKKELDLALKGLKILEVDFNFLNQESKKYKKDVKRLKILQNKIWKMKIPKWEIVKKINDAEI